MLAKQCIEDIKTYQSHKSILSTSNFVVALALGQSIELRVRFKNSYKQPNRIRKDISFTNELKSEVEKLFPTIINEAHEYCEDHYFKLCRHCISDFPMKSSVHAIRQILRTEIINS